MKCQKLEIFLCLNCMHSYLLICLYFQTYSPHFMKCIDRRPSEFCETSANVTNWVTDPLKVLEGVHQNSEPTLVCFPFILISGRMHLYKHMGIFLLIFTISEKSNIIDV